MNHQEEQTSELEALQSIYPVELEIESSDFPASFKIQVKCEDFDDDDPDCVECCLKYKFTETYPDAPPELSIESASENLTENGDEELERRIVSKLKSIAENNLGIVMCFTLVSALQEELNAIRERFKNQRIYESERAKREEEEAERKKHEGTRVTVENFLIWKQKFDAERKILRQKQGFVDLSEKISRPTGREQFLKNADLITSDIRLIEESGEEVKIDETLFQDFDDLDLENEEELMDEEID